MEHQSTLNPKELRWIVQGLGGYEDVKYSSKGSLISNGFLSYTIPTTKTIHKLTTEFEAMKNRSIWCKISWERNIDTPPEALANAVFNATGVRITKLPITAEKIYQGMLELKQKENRK